jgi:hypothetical protein
VRDVQWGSHELRQRRCGCGNSGRVKNSSPFDVPRDALGTMLGRLHRSRVCRWTKKLPCSSRRHLLSPAAKKQGLEDQVCVPQCRCGDGGYHNHGSVALRAGSTTGRPLSNACHVSGEMAMPVAQFLAEGVRKSRKYQTRVYPGFWWFRIVRIGSRKSRFMRRA